MRTLTILLSICLLLPAETPKPTPPAPLKTAILSEVEQLKVENIQLRLQLVKASEAELSAALNAVFMAKCQTLGGTTMADCTAMGPTQAQPGYSVTLRLVQAKAKAEVR